MPIKRQENDSAKKVVVSKKETPTKVSASKKPVRKTVKKVAKEKKARTVQVGRKSDGTFAPGNTFGRNPGGRPKDAFSYRAIAKVMASEDPDSITDGVKTLHNIVKSAETSPMEKMKALELLIKLNGNFDPQETKDVSEKEIFNPFENLTEDELRKLAK
jgi:hypothetical protein|nr:MAG TPA: hypothetical protein [Caudoviricetes sp.]